MKIKVVVLIGALAFCTLPGFTKQPVTYSIDFYSDTLHIGFDEDFFATFCGELTQENIQQFYDRLTNGKHQEVVHQLLNYKKQHGLDDWFYYQLVRKVAGQISPKSQNYEQYTLYKWFLMGKSGYDVTLAYTQKHLLFYIRSNENIYDIPFYTRNGHQYVCLNYHDYGKIDFNREQISECTTFFPEGNQEFSYKITNVPEFRNDVYAEKDIQFNYHQQSYQFRIKVNAQVQNIFQNYPVVDFDSYFNIPLSKETYASLIPSLKEQVKHMSVPEGVDYLMHFTRDAFAFQTDQENFGKEKRMSPEQTLLYNRSDCDDRASLFFFLVKEIYNVPMIALLYPTHVTIAVQFDARWGKPVVYKGEKYYICDPTPQYVDLQVGQISQSLRKQPYQVVYEYIPGK